MLALARFYFACKAKPPKLDNVMRRRARDVSNEPLAGTEYCIAMIPLGGYVKMLDERDTFVADDLLDFALTENPCGNER